MDMFVVFRRVQAHSGELGNVLADNEAKEMTKYANTDLVITSAKQKWGILSENKG